MHLPTFSKVSRIIPTAPAKQRIPASFRRPHTRELKTKIVAENVPRTQLITPATNPSCQPASISLLKLLDSTRPARNIILVIREGTIHLWFHYATRQSAFNIYPASRGKKHTREENRGSVYRASRFPAKDRWSTGRKSRGRRMRKIAWGCESFVWILKPSPSMVCNCLTSN